MSWVVAAVAVALVVLAMDWLAGRIVRPNLQPVDRPVPSMGIPYEELTVRSGEHELRAWLLHPSRSEATASVEEGGAPVEGRGPVEEDGASSGPAGRPYGGSTSREAGLDDRRPLVIVAHGWGANHGVVARLAEPLARRGWTVLLFDVRGHGRNHPLPEVTIRDFRDDVMAVTRYVEERFPHRPSVLVGHSMGGAAGVVAAADGAPIDGLVTVAAPSDVLGVTAEYLSDHGLPGEILVTVLRPFFWRRVGGTFRPLTPSRRIDELTIPIMMIQPELDARVVRAHADRLAAVTGLDYHVIEGREHTDVLSDPRTLALVEDFLDSVSGDDAVRPPGARG